MNVLKDLVNNFKDHFAACFGLAIIIRLLIDYKFPRIDSVTGFSLILTIVFATIKTLYEVFNSKFEGK